MPLTGPEIISSRKFLGESFSRTGCLLLLLLALISTETLLCAQAVQIKLLDGRNGSPLAGTCMNVWVGGERKSPMAVPTDESGVARLRLTDKDAEIDVHDSSEQCGEFGVTNPVVRYDDALRVNVRYVSCLPHAPDYSWLAVSRFSADQVIRQGIVTPNSCGKAKASPEPGKLIIFVRPVNWWEKFKY
jgi:hypothetical protein